MKKLSVLIILIAFLGLNEAIGQWSFNDTHIYNSNTGNVGIGTSSPPTLLYVTKNMTEPTITIRNLGGYGGATYSMIDDASGANWKFKATLSGGFKIRDHSNGLDVIIIEPNSLANALYINNTGNVGIGTATPDNSALVDMTSTTKGFLPPRLNSAQIEAISSPADGLMVYNTSDEHLCIYNSLTNAWLKVAYESPLPCGTSFTLTHEAGSVAPVTKTVTYGTHLTNLTGSSKCWITQNLGADHQATSATDATEASSGWYWQFNRQQGFKHDGTTRTPNTPWITSIDENSNWQPANDPCVHLLGLGWRLPSYTEWNNADINGGWDNRSEAYSSVLFLHAAGLIIGSGSLTFRGSTGDYCSSTQNNNTTEMSLYIDGAGCDMLQTFKTSGTTVRCLRDY